MATTTTLTYNELRTFATNKGFKSSKSPTKAQLLEFCDSLKDTKSTSTRRSGWTRQEVLRRREEVMQKTIEVLRKSGRPMRAADMQRGVDELLGETRTSWSDMHFALKSTMGVNFRMVQVEGRKRKHYTLK